MPFFLHWDFFLKGQYPSWRPKFGDYDNLQRGNILPASGFDPWVGKIPWRGKWQPTPGFLPGEPPWTEEPGGLQSIGSQESDISD